MEKELKSAAISFAGELARVKSMPDMPSYFYELVEKSFIKFARPAVENDRAALHKELLDKLPKEEVYDKSAKDDWDMQMGFNNCLDAVRKAIDEVFSKKL